MDEITFSIIIPTYNRPVDLKKCVGSLANQDSPPSEVIIVDDGDLREEVRNHLRDTLPNSSTLIFSQSQGTPGISAARNRGIELASATIIVFLDDDIELEESYLSRLRSVYESHDNPDLAGVGGFESKLRKRRYPEKLFNRIFYLPTNGWGINEVGVQSFDSTINDITKSDWLSGKNASYKLSVLGDEPFRQCEGGRETLEDVDLGWELSQQGYYFLIDPDLSFVHHDKPILDSSYNMGAKMGRNRYRIFSRHGDRSKWPLFWWCMLGEITRHFVAPIIDRRTKYHLSIALGIAFGLLQMAASELYQKRQTH